MDISIVVPSYQSAGTIGDTIEALLAQETALSYEIIVVDSSTDNTTEVIAGYPGVRLIHLDHRAYSGEARNVGVEQASGSIISFTDSDCIPEPRWLQKMWEAHQTWDCIAVGGAVVNGNPESPVSCASYITEFSRYMPVGKRRYQVGCATCNTSYKAWAFREYGGFEPWLKKYVDYTFNSKLHRAGERLLFDPDIVVRHHHRIVVRRYAEHELARGQAAVIVRRMGLLPGSRLVRSRAISLAIAPALFPMRVAADFRRVTMVRGQVLRSFSTALPAFLVGLAAWTVGFAGEALRPTSLEQDVPEHAGQQPPTESAAEVANE